jgi:hypothetical protein
MIDDVMMFLNEMCVCGCVFNTGASIVLSQAGRALIRRMIPCNFLPEMVRSYSLIAKVREPRKAWTQRNIYLRCIIVMFQTRKITSYDLIYYFDLILMINETRCNCGNTSDSQGKEEPKACRRRCFALIHMTSGTYHQRHKSNSCIKPRACTNTKALAIQVENPHKQNTQPTRPAHESKCKNLN